MVSILYVTGFSKILKGKLIDIINSVVAKRFPVHICVVGVKSLESDTDFGRSEFLGRRLEGRKR